jgi:hypothetical protein
MSWLSLLKIVLQLASFVARRAERLDIEKAVLNELENAHGKRVDAAVAARDDVLAGGVQPDANDPYRRD